MPGPISMTNPPDVNDTEAMREFLRELRQAPVPIPRPSMIAVTAAAPNSASTKKQE